MRLPLAMAALFFQRGGAPARGGVDGCIDAPLRTAVEINQNSADHQCTLALEVIKRGADWTPGKPVPLKPEVATRIALELLAKKFPAIPKESWQVYGIKMLPLYGTGYRKWYYSVWLVVPENPAKLQGSAMIFVAMDGTPGDLE